LSRATLVSLSNAASFHKTIKLSALNQPFVIPFITGEIGVS
jgi:hypothetical protein